MATPKFDTEGTQDVPRMESLRPKRDLSLDDIQNEDWLVRILESVKESKVINVDAALLDELNSVMAECAESYGDKKSALPVVREPDDLESLAAKESRCVSLMARIAEITISLYRIRKGVDGFWDMCEERINRYPVVNRELTNDRKRTLYYRVALKPLRDKQVKLELAFETASKIEEHLNSVHFAIKEMSAMGRDYLTRTTMVDRNEVR